MTIEKLQKRLIDLQTAKNHVQQQFFIVTGQISEIENQIKELSSLQSEKGDVDGN